MEVRYSVRPTGSIQAHHSARYILCMESHFIGLRVHADGTMDLKANRHSAATTISTEELASMPLEAAFHIYERGTVGERAERIAENVECSCARAPNDIVLYTLPGVVDYLGGAAPTTYLDSVRRANV